MHLGAREGRQSKRIVQGIPEIKFLAQKVEYSPKRRQNELERAENWSSARSGTTTAPPGSRLGSFKAARLSGNDVKTARR